MKKSMKMTALVLSALMLSSAMTTAASAADIFLGSTGGILISPKPSIDAENDYAVSGDTTVVTGADKNIFKKVDVNGIYAEKEETKEEKPEKPVTPQKPTPDFVKHSYCKYHKKYDYCGYEGKMYGYKYYSKVNSSEYINDYYEKNTINLNMYKGETRKLNSDVYYLSENPDVAYYDKETSEIVAASVGSTNIYVCTKGAVPIICIKVNVEYKFIAEKPVKLIIDDKDWNLRIGESIKLNVTASDGKSYDDIIFKVTRGQGRVSVDKESGRIEALRNGAAVICAYRASDPDVHGEILIYVGANINGVLNGCFTKYDDRIEVNDWFDGEFDANSYYDIVGWIRGTDGTLLPVIAKNYVGIIMGDKETYLKYFERLWGDNVNANGILSKYNFIKYSKYWDKFFPCGYDANKFFFVSNLIGIFNK